MHTQCLEENRLGAEPLNIRVLRGCWQGASSHPSLSLPPLLCRVLGGDCVAPKATLGMGNIRNQLNEGKQTRWVSLDPREDRKRPLGTA